MPINVDEKEFEILMNIYKKASDQVLQNLKQINEEYARIYGNNIVSNITSRIKTPHSIVNKMKNKNLELSYKSLVDNINDIAGIRVVCPIKSNIYTMIKIIEKMPNIKILKSKDYMNKPKKSGYSGYHLIIETTVEIEQFKLPVKVEIQMRTMAMDFWATNEHKIKYKTNKKLSFWDSKKLTIYAKILNFLDDKIMNIYHKQERA